MLALWEQTSALGLHLPPLALLVTKQHQINTHYSLSPQLRPQDFHMYKCKNNLCTLTVQCFLDRSVRYYINSYLQKCTYMFHSNGLKTNLDAEILWTLFPSAKRKLQNHSLFWHLHSIAALESMDRNQQRNLALPTHFIPKDFNTAAFCQDTRGLSWLPIFNMKMWDLPEVIHKN